MNERDARAFIATAVSDSGGVWADFGAGTGTFTRALQSLLHPDSRVYAIDSDPAAVAALQRIGGNVIALHGDFAEPLTLPESPVDGMLFANALHFVPDAADVLRRFVEQLKTSGRVVIVEYDRRAANPWVPHPIGSDRWPTLAASVGLAEPVVTARRQSEYSGELYVATALRNA